MNILKSIPITVTVGNNVFFFLKNNIYIYGDGVRERESIWRWSEREREYMAMEWERERYRYILRGLAHPLCYSHRLSPLSRPRIGDLGWLQPDELKSRFGPAFSEAAFFWWALGNHKFHRRCWMLFLMMMMIVILVGSKRSQFIPPLLILVGLWWCNVM